MCLPIVQPEPRFFIRHVIFGISRPPVKQTSFTISSTQSGASVTFGII
jgi:hypothetical protein